MAFLEEINQPTIMQAIINFALKFVGEKEKDNNSGFENPVFEEEMKNTGWQKGLSWCCFFAKLVWKNAYIDNILVTNLLESYFSGSVLETWKNFDNSIEFKTRTEKNKVFTNPVLGAIAIFRYDNSIKGHCGIVIAIISDNEFLCVEGNGNSKGGREGIEVVVRKRKSKDFKKNDLNFVGFILPKNDL